MKGRLTASPTLDHLDAASLDDGPLEVWGPTYVRLVVQLSREEPELLPVLTSVTWTYDGQPLAAVATEWERWEHDGALYGGFLYAPEFDVGDLSDVAKTIAVQLVTVDGLFDFSGSFALAPKSEPEPRHPLVDHLATAGGSDRLVDLVERRITGDPLTNAEGAELLAALPTVNVDTLETEAALALADVMGAVQAKQKADAEALARLREATGG